MIIDLILNRKDGEEYTPRGFYNSIMCYSGDFATSISEAMDYGEEFDVKNSLCDYIIKNEYNDKITKYIKSVNWL